MKKKDRGRNAWCASRTRFGGYDAARGVVRGSGLALELDLDLEDVAVRAHAVTAHREVVDRAVLVGLDRTHEQDGIAAVLGLVLHDDGLARVREVHVPEGRLETRNVREDLDAVREEALGVRVVVDRDAVDVLLGRGLEVGGEAPRDDRCLPGPVHRARGGTGLGVHERHRRDEDKAEEEHEREFQEVHYRFSVERAVCVSRDAKRPGNRAYVNNSIICYSCQVFLINKKQPLTSCFFDEKLEATLRLRSSSTPYIPFYG